MKRIVAVAATLVLTLSACNGADDPEPGPTGGPTTSPTPTATETQEQELTLAPGRFGPVRVGMTKDEAAATGLFDVDVETGDDVCEPVTPLVWKEPYRDKIDVLTSQEGTIVSMGVLRDETLATDTGIRVGSTLGEINEAYGDQVSPADEAGFNQSGVWVNEGDDWIGFLFDESYTDVDESAKVVFIEVTTGEKPGLIRSGC